MFRRLFVAVVGVSAVLTIGGAVLAEPRPLLPSASKVFIAPMAGFRPYFLAAATAANLPLGFVRTRAQADYEITGVTQASNLLWEEGVRDHVTIRQDTTVRMTRIKSGETVFQHSVRTLVRAPNDGARIVNWGTVSQTPSSLTAIAKETAARRCVRALAEWAREQPN
jgi:hypothetical protein